MHCASKHRAAVIQGGGACLVHIMRLFHRRLVYTRCSMYGSFGGGVHAPKGGAL